MDDEDAHDASGGVIVQMVNRIVEDAYSQGASDVHIETLNKKEGVAIRFRIDGDCLSYRKIPYNYKNSLVSRIKIIAKYQ